MTREQILKLRKDFDHYVDAFAVAGDGIHPLLQLKAKHSRRVADEARMLSADLGWSASERNVAEALGLLHDIGRFSQFLKYHTFADSASVDHGEYGWTVTGRTAWLSGLTIKEREAILNGIRYHNRRAIPEEISPQSLPFLRLIRDADKLDIFRVVLEAVERDGFRDLLQMLPGVVLDRSVSPQVIKEIEDHRRCSLSNVRSLGDFLLMQLSWVYNLNYIPTFWRVSDRDIILRIMRHFEGVSRIQKLEAKARQFVAERLSVGLSRRKQYLAKQVKTRRWYSDHKREISAN